MLIRCATPDDLDEVVEFWQHYGGPTRSIRQHDQARELVAHNAEALILAVDEAGSVVGTLIVGWDGWRCHLYRLAVHPTVRRTRVATALLAEAQARAKALGATRVDAMVHRDNPGAIAFWEARGFDLQDDDERWSLVL